MLTGMPISISLGLTVLTFLFTMTTVPIESVGLKLFSGLDNFSIAFDPVLHSHRLVFDPRRCRPSRMINFTTAMVGHWPRRPRPLHQRRRLRAVRGDLGLERRHRRRDRLDHDAGDGRARLSAPVRRRRDHDLGRARHPGAALDHPGAVRRVDQLVGRRAVHGRHHSGPDPGGPAGHGHVVHRLAQRLPAHAASSPGRERLAPRSTTASGA